MAMERLENVLRQTGNVRDEIIANGIESFRKLRGRDIPIGIFLGIEGNAEQSLTSKNTLHKQAADAIRQRILAGEFDSSGKLPSETLFLQQLKESGIGVSRMTLREGMRILAEERLIFRVQGKGTFLGARGKDIP